MGGSGWGRVGGWDLMPGESLLGGPLYPADLQREERGTPRNSEHWHPTPTVLTRLSPPAVGMTKWLLQQVGSPGGSPQSLPGDGAATFRAPSHRRADFVITGTAGTFFSKDHLLFLFPSQILRKISMN